MFIVQVEHPVHDYEAWKSAFESDPVGRERSGVRRYRIMRLVDDPNYVAIELDFESSSEAEAFLTALRAMWARVDGTIMMKPKARIVEMVEAKTYGGTA